VLLVRETFGLVIVACLISDLSRSVEIRSFRDIWGAVIVPLVLLLLRLFAVITARVCCARKGHDACCFLQGQMVHEHVLVGGRFIHHD